VEERVREVTLSDGGTMPMVGLGTWPMDDAECEKVVAQGLELGYRLVDTAYAYGNETGVGRGVAVSGIERQDVFITTKFNAHSHSVQGVRAAWEDSARKLGVDYIDLMLIHWPCPWQDQYVDAWEGLIAIQQEGKVKHIGVSSFLPEHVDRIIDATGVVPVLNQMQINPRYQQVEARAYNDAHGIHTQAWSPLGQGTGLLELPVLKDIATRYGSTPGQVVLAWDVALGMSAVPKSSDPARMVQNLEAPDLVLAPEDVARISAIDVSEPDIKHPNSFGH
jgi:2,5-diketo-D-gluconate reductase A